MAYDRSPEWKVACFCQGEDVLMAKSILYLFDTATNSGSITDALEATGYGVVKANCSTQAIALLFLMKSVAMVVLQERPKMQKCIALARSMRKLRPDVTIILLSCKQIDPLPSCVDASLCTEEPRENLTSVVRYFLSENPRLAPQGKCDLPHAA